MKDGNAGSLVWKIVRQISIRAEVFEYFIFVSIVLIPTLCAAISVFLHYVLTTDLFMSPFKISSIVKLVTM